LNFASDNLEAVPIPEHGVVFPFYPLTITHNSISNCYFQVSFPAFDGEQVMACIQVKFL